MAHIYTLQPCLPGGEWYLLEYDGNRIIAARPYTNVDPIDLLGTLADIENDDMPDTLDAQWHENADWAHEQQWGDPLTFEGV